jgi:hypothetical protein
MKKTMKPKTPFISDEARPSLDLPYEDSEEVSSASAWISSGPAPAKKAAAIGNIDTSGLSDVFVSRQATPKSKSPASAGKRLGVGPGGPIGRSHGSSAFRDTISPFAMEETDDDGEVHIPKKVAKTYLPPTSRSLDGLRGISPSEAEDFDTVQESLKVIKTEEHTIVYTVVIDRENEDNNKVSAIQCWMGNAFGGYARDRSKDTYLISCVDCINIGEVPFSLAVSMPKVGNWRVPVPIPEPLLHKHFTPQQNKLLDEFKEKYAANKYEIHYVQLLGCNI